MERDKRDRKATSRYIVEREKLSEEKEKEKPVVNKRQPRKQPVKQPEQSKSPINALRKSPIAPAKTKKTARMHCSARRAGYPSVSSRAARQQPRTRLAGGGPPHYVYSVDRLRHLRHRLRPLCGWAVPPVRRPGAGPGEKPLPPHPAAAAGPGAVHRRHRHWAAAAARWRCLARVYEPRVGNPPPSSD
jgi:hypothetical protein